MPRVAHFEIHGSNPETLIAFYRDLFGWAFDGWGPQGGYWMIRTGANDEPGIDGGLTLRRGDPPVEGAAVNAYVCTVVVPSARDSLEKALALGGVQAVPLSAVPGVGWLCYVKDPGGNILGIMQSDTAAA